MGHVATCTIGFSRSQLYMCAVMCCLKCSCHRLTVDSHGLFHCTVLVVGCSYCDFVGDSILCCPGSASCTGLVPKISAHQLMNGTVARQCKCRLMVLRPSMRL